MKTTDARLKSTEVQQHIREQIITLFNQGRSRKEIAQILGVNYYTVQKLIKLWQRDGDSALKIGDRGRREGSGRSLSLAQERTVQSMIGDKMPDQLKLPFALWTRKAVQQLIYDLWRIKITLRCVGNYLKRWGFTPQKPAKRAYERCPKKVQKWLDEQYPKIANEAKAQGATIYWADEAGVKNQCQHGRSYAPVGKTPVQCSTGKKLKLNMISAITNQGRLLFMTYRDKMNANRFIEFLDRIIDSTTGKAVVILDNLRVHHAKKVKQWVQERKTFIELHFLPAYSPDLNPDEYLNCDLKNSVANAPAARTQKGFEKVIRGNLRSIQNQPERVKKYFKAESIRYAA